MADIRVYHTHIEIFPYKKGHNTNLEKMLSIYNKSRHRYDPVGYYLKDDILYLPRGISPRLLAHIFSSIPAIVHDPDPFDKIKCNFDMICPPKSKIEEDAINFLLSKNQFINNGEYSQFGLNLDTGDGKTYSMVSALSSLKLKTIIIVDRKKIQEQWLYTISDMSTMDTSKVCLIDSKIDISDLIKEPDKYDIYIVTHQRLQRYAKKYSWTSVKELFIKLHIGVKVYDEAHLFFKNILMIDFFSNTKYNYYLTATFKRGDFKENSIFKMAFSNLAKFGEETYSYEEKRKHINFFTVYYNSGCTQDDKIFYEIITKYNFSSYGFIKYALNESTNSLWRVTEKILSDTKDYEGRTLVLSPTIDSLEEIAKKIRKISDKKVCTIHTKNKPVQNREAYDEGEIIVSTIKSLGAGTDIKGLRIVICLEPMGSQVRADQVRGRLREYSPTDDTYFYYPVDSSIEECVGFVKRILPVMKRKCKSITYLRY